MVVTWKVTKTSEIGGAGKPQSACTERPGPKALVIETEFINCVHPGGPLPSSTTSTLARLPCIENFVPLVALWWTTQDFTHRQGSLACFCLWLQNNILDGLSEFRLTNVWNEIKCKLCSISNICLISDNVGRNVHAVMPGTSGADQALTSTHATICSHTGKRLCRQAQPWSVP